MGCFQFPTLLIFANKCKMSAFTLKLISKNKSSCSDSGAQESYRWNRDRVALQIILPDGSTVDITQRYPFHNEQPYDAWEYEYIKGAEILSLDARLWVRLWSIDDAEWAVGGPFERAEVWCSEDGGHSWVPGTVPKEAKVIQKVEL